MLTILGSLIGGLFRLAPELFAFLDKKHDRAHELSMLDKQLALDKFRAEAGERIAVIDAEKSVDIAEIQALIAGAQAQSRPTGNPKVDALNATVRPVLTYWWCIGLSTAALVAEFAVLYQAGVGLASSFNVIWGEEEKAIVASIFSFWFLDRALRHRRRRS